jgi:ATP synthase protein I
MVRAVLRAADLRGLATVRVESMADGARENDPRDNSPNDEAALSARLRHLGDRLTQAGRPDDHVEQPRSSADPSMIARGFRLSSELVAGVIVGGIIGWLLDRWLGISPWGLIVFLLLGFAAGVLNVMRAAGVIRPNRIDEN